jgi:hypothetical protein
MWKRKSPSDRIATDKSEEISWPRRVLTSFILAGGIACLIFVLMQIVPHSRLLRPVSPGVAAVVSSMLFAVLFVLAILRPREPEYDTFICGSCHEVTSDDADEICKMCGGVLEPLNHWEWHEPHRRKGNELLRTETDYFGGSWNAVGYVLELVICLYRCLRWLCR